MENPGQQQSAEPFAALRPFQSKDQCRLMNMEFPMRFPRHHHPDCFPMLQTVLPANRMLLADHAARTLMLVDTKKDFPETIIALDSFKTPEWRVLLLLLEAYPQGVAHAQLLAALHNHSPAYGREQLTVARQDKQLRELLRPLRETVTNLRRRLEPFGLSIAIQYAKGYVISFRT